jgi:hypothetical protein
MKRKPLLKELNDEERTIILPLLIKLFREKTHETKHLTADVIIDKFNEKKDVIGFKSAFNKQRFMKLTNYIRAQKQLKLVSCNTGYYVSNNPEVLEECAQSLLSRIESIRAAAAGLNDMAAELRHEASMKEVCPLGFTWD